MIVNLQFCLLVLIISGLSSVFAAQWSEWMDITPCSTKPCECDPPYNAACDSKGRKAQIRQCIRGKGEIDTCKGGGPFRIDTGCNNKNRCPGWSEWSVVSECDCTTNEWKVERLCNNPAPIHPEVLCMKFDSSGGTIEEGQQPCECSADKITETTATPTIISTVQTSTTEKPWCCEMFLDKIDNDFGDYGNGSDYGESQNIDGAAEDREARSADGIYYNYYDNVCNECSEEKGYKGKHGKPKDDNKSNGFFSLEKPDGQ